MKRDCITVRQVCGKRIAEGVLSVAETFEKRRSAACVCHYAALRIRFVNGVQRQ